MADVHGIKPDLSSLLSSKIDKFYQNLEIEHWSSLPRNAISEKIALQDIFKELKKLKHEVVKANTATTKPRERLQIARGNLHLMACSEVKYWRKAIVRREFMTAKHNRPWIVEFSSRLQKEIYCHIVELLTCSSMYGVKIQGNITGSSKVKAQVIQVTKKEKVEQLFRYVLGDEESFKRTLRGKGRTDIIVDETRPFVITYSVPNETVKIECYYGAWNTQDVPQFT